MSKKVIGSILKFEAISDRICLLRVRTMLFNITRINAYAPTESSEEETTNRFYEELGVVVDQISEYDAKIVNKNLTQKLGTEKIVPSQIRLT